MSANGHGSGTAAELEDLAELIHALREGPPRATDTPVALEPEPAAEEPPAVESKADGPAFTTALLKALGHPRQPVAQRSAERVAELPPGENLFPPPRVPATRPPESREADSGLVRRVRKHEKDAARLRRRLRELEERVELLEEELDRERVTLLTRLRLLAGRLLRRG